MAIVKTVCCDDCSREIPPKNQVYRISITAAAAGDVVKPMFGCDIIADKSFCSSCFLQIKNLLF